MRQWGTCHGQREGWELVNFEEVAKTNRYCEVVVVEEACRNAETSTPGASAEKPEQAGTLDIVRVGGGCGRVSVGVVWCCWFAWRDGVEQRRRSRWGSLRP